MASYFGEIGALSSRAVDDEEFENESTYRFKMETADDFSEPAACKLLIFSVGKVAASFVHCYLVPQNPHFLFGIKYALDKDDSDSIMSYGGLKIQCSKGKKAASAFTVNSEIIVCEISSQVPEDYNMELLDMVLSKINATQALVLTSQHVSNYKTDTSTIPAAPFLKALGTSQYVLTNALTSARLQSPNIILGFPAAVLSEFEVKKKQALCVVNYLDMDVLDSLNVQGFESIRNEHLVVTLPFKNDAESSLIKYIKSHANQSNLYA